MRNKIIITMLLLFSLVIISGASTIYIYPSGPIISQNQSVTFITSTTSCFFDLPYNSCKSLVQDDNGISSWATVSNETNSQLEFYSHGQFNETGLNINGDTVDFTKPGVWQVYVTFYNSSPPFETNSTISTVTVDAPLKVKIEPHLPQAVYGASVPLSANVTGGTGNFKFQWYFGSACNDAIVNATGQAFTTNIIVVPGSVYPVNTPDITNVTDYCVNVNDSTGEVVRANTTINMFQNLQTSQGTLIAVQNHTVLLAPSIINTNSSSYIVLNATPYAIWDINLCGSSIDGYLTSLTPTYVNMSIDGSPYGLFVNQSLPLGGNGCFIKLLNIAWNSQLVSTSALEIYQTQPTTTTSTSTSTTSTSSASSTSVSTVSTVSTTTVPPTTTIAPLTASVKASNVLKSSNTIISNKSSANGNWEIGILVIAIIAIGAFALLYRKRGKSPKQPVDKQSMVNL